MRPENRDAAYIWDMLEAAVSVTEFVKDLTSEQFLQNRMVQAAVERQVEILGEAARRVSDPFKTAHPEIPWRRIVGMRNVLAHEYGEIIQSRMWALTVDQIPELIVQLEPLITPSPKGTSGRTEGGSK